MRVWYNKHRSQWQADGNKNGICIVAWGETVSEAIAEFVKAVKRAHIGQHCGNCGHYAPYSNSDGSPDTYGNCLSIAFNKECNEGANPFKDDEIPLVEVEGKDPACAYYRFGRTNRIRAFIKKHPTWYSVKRPT